MHRPHQLSRDALSLRHSAIPPYSGGEGWRTGHRRVACDRAAGEQGTDALRAIARGAPSQVDEDLMASLKKRLNDGAEGEGGGAEGEGGGGGADGADGGGDGTAPPPSPSGIGGGGVGGAVLEPPPPSGGGGGGDESGPSQEDIDRLNRMLGGGGDK